MSSQHITSRQNARVKDAAKLRDRKARERQGRFIIDGAREIVRALDAGIDVVEAFVCEPRCVTAEAQAAAEKLQLCGAAVATVTADVFEKMCFGEGRDGLVAAATPPQRSLTDLTLPPAPLVAVLEGVEKPGNAGAVLRSADGAGVDAVVLVAPRTDLFNPNTIRASLGTVFNRNVRTATAEDALAWLGRLDVPIYAARPGAARAYSDADYTRGAAVVLGSEADGLTSAWTQAAVTDISLPMHGLADSLNVSAAAAVLFYEAQRQRGRGISPRTNDAPRPAY